jgi:hypothetical protein
MTKTIAVEMVVSLRLGQVTLAASWRTCWMNCTGVTFAMALFLSVSRYP